jgi:hypothetical protein
MTYPDPVPNQPKTWKLYLAGTSPVDVQAYSIEYTRNHVVFKTYQGVTFMAYRSEDVRRIELQAW